MRQVKQNGQEGGGRGGDLLSHEVPKENYI